MADERLLRPAVAALFSPDTFPRFARVPDGVRPPWTYVLTSIPSIRSRSLASTALSRRVIIRARCTAMNEDALWHLVDAVTGDLEGTRPVADGWLCTPVAHLNEDPVPFEDRELKYENNAHPLVVALDFDFHATATT